MFVTQQHGLKIVQRGAKVKATAVSNDTENKSRVVETGLTPPRYYMLAVVLDGVPVVEAK